MSEVIDFIKETHGVINEIIVFGAGQYGSKAIGVMSFIGIRVISCFDNDADNQGKRVYNNILCERPHTTNIPILIAIESKEATDIIKRQLLDMNIKQIYTIELEKLDEAMLKLPDKDFLNLRYYIVFKRNISWKNPKAFNEKLQWMKLNDHNPNYPIMVDKATVKDYVAKIIGMEYIIPTIGIWDNVEDICFSTLPDKYVIKCTHDSGSALIVNNKIKSRSWVRLQIQQLKKALEKDMFILGREWPYKMVKPRIIVEELLEDEEQGELLDYKFMCFSGKVKCSFICSNRRSSTGLNVTFYDRDWNIMPFERHYPRETKPRPKPFSYDLMIELAEKISKGLPFVRIDFYEVKGHPFFGEITLYPGCGFEEFSPNEWDEIMGSWLKLPQLNEANLS